MVDHRAELRIPRNEGVVKFGLVCGVSSCSCCGGLWESRPWLGAGSSWWRCWPRKASCPRMDKGQRMRTAWCVFVLVHYDPKVVFLSRED